MPKTNNPYGVQPEGPWRTFRISKKFMDRLANVVGENWFSLTYAYYIYQTYHWTAKGSYRDNSYWMEVTVRQYLSAATQRGVLERVRRGVYRFSK